MVYGYMQFQFKHGMTRLLQAGLSKWQTAIRILMFGWLRQDLHCDSHKGVFYAEFFSWKWHRNHTLIDLILFYLILTLHDVAYC